MSGTLTASFRLTLQDQMSSPLQQVMRQLDALKRLAGGLNLGGLDGAQKTLDGTASGAGKVTRALGEVGRAARGMGQEFRAATADAIAGLDTMQQKLRAISAADIRRAVNTAAAPASPIGGAPRAAATLRGAARGFGHSVGEFGEATESAGGRLLGAAMTGFGLIEPVERYAEMDREIRSTAVDLNVPLAGMNSYVRAQRERDYAIALGTGQSSRDVARAAHYLALTNMDQKSIDAMLPGIARVATAYNGDMNDIAATGFHAFESLGIKPQDVETALAHAGAASKIGHVGFNEMAQLIPGLMTQAHAAGYHGERGLDQLLSYLVVSRRGSATPGEAATNLSSFLTHIFEPANMRSFKKAGIDLKGVLTQADKQGVDPIMAVLQRVQGLVKGKDATQTSLILGQLFGRKEEAQFVQAALAHMKEIQDAQAKIGGVTTADTANDVKKQMTGVSPLLAQMKEQVDQVSDRFAQGFVPVLRVVSGALGLVLPLLTSMDHLMPGLSNGITGTIGVSLALATGLGVLGAVAAPLGRGLKVLRAGFMLARAGAIAFGGALSVPIVVAAAVAIAIGAAILDITNHWKRFAAFFQQITAGFHDVMRGNIGHGLVEVFSGAIGVVKQMFIDLLHWIDGWSGGFVSSLEAPLKGFENEFANSKLGHFLGFGAAGAGTGGKIEIHVSADPGVGVAAKNGAQGVSVHTQAPARGPMTSRP